MAKSGATVRFKAIRDSEHQSINKRRKALNRNPVQPVQRGKATAGSKEPIFDTVGLALSGGGVRSASFCLGALQALQASGVLNYVDYLSTVSGGGYIGSSMTAAMSRDGGSFPFESKLDHEEPEAVQHIRDHSNYLMPNGFTDILGSVAIFLRGIVANILLVLPWLLFFAALTVYLNPDREALIRPNLGDIRIPNPFDLRHFGITADLAIVAALFLAGWGLWRSVRLKFGFTETGSWVTRAVGYWLLVILLVAFCEAQPLVLRLLFDAADEVAKPEKAGTFAASLAVVIAALLAAIGSFWSKLEKLVKRATESSKWRARIASATSKFVLLGASAVMPLLLWVVYLLLCFWAIDGRKPGIAGAAAEQVGQEPLFAAPKGLNMTADSIREFLALRFSEAVIPQNKFVILYVSVGLGLLVISWFQRPNANSLHRLYRDRLSKAFLFDASLIGKIAYLFREIRTQGLMKSLLGISGRRPGRNALTWLDAFKLRELSEEHAPYQIINAALNIHASEEVNRRGRNADFFVFSRNYIGSEATDYAPTVDMERVAADLDLATAMAVSGAAASSNMGSRTIRPLTPTLTLLNVRLGYWLRNPNSISLRARLLAKLVNSGNLYFFLELFGLLRETSWLVYLTDGGHIENLGIYQLLKRRCRLILAVDAEADPDMNFDSFVTLQRHARIDLGVRIELPWHEIRKTALEVNKEMATNSGAAPAKPRMGPHCAVGRILYDDDQWGILIYFKASITGDENDYIMDYKRRHVSFPHETTGDQFFSEEQFEVYRALGFHVVHRAFSGAEAVPTHAGKNGGAYKPVWKLWKGARFDDARMDKAKEVWRFAAGKSGAVVPAP